MSAFTGDGSDRNSAGCLWRLDVPPCNDSVVGHSMHVADFLSAAHLKNFQASDGRGMIIDCRFTF